MSPVGFSDCDINAAVWSVIDNEIIEFGYIFGEQVAGESVVFANLLQEFGTRFGGSPESLPVHLDQSEARFKGAPLVIIEQ